MSSTLGHDHDAELDPPRVQEVSDGVFAYIQPDGTWFINNTGFLVGAAGVTSVDACSTERRTRAYLEAIAETSPQPVRTLINTHHHGDHTHGNYLFGGATIVAHDRCRDEVLAAGLPYFPGVWQDVDWGDDQSSAALPHLLRQGHPLQRRPALRGPLRRQRRRTPPTTPSSGCQNAPSFSPATCSSTAARRSC